MVFSVLKETQRAKPLILQCPKKLAARFPAEATSSLLLRRQHQRQGLLTTVVGTLMAGVLEEALRDLGWVRRRSLVACGQECGAAIRGALCRPFEASAAYAIEGPVGLLTAHLACGVVQMSPVIQVVARSKLSGVVAAFTKPIVLHIQCKGTVWCPALHGCSLTVQEKARSSRRCAAGPCYRPFRCPSARFANIPTGGARPSCLQFLRCCFGGLFSSFASLGPPLKALMAVRLRVHRHVERAIWRFTFHLQEGELGKRQFLSVPGAGLSSSRFSILLPFLVLMLYQLKVIFHEVYFFGNVAFI